MKFSLVPEWSPYPGLQEALKALQATLKPRWPGTAGEELPMLSLALMLLLSPQTFVFFLFTTIISRSWG